jgi:uncharacterized protein
VIFVDSNVPMYLIGAEHPLKHSARRRIDQSISLGDRLVTSAEVLQEILHRYVSINRRDAIQPAFDALLGVVDDVLDVTGADAHRARELVLGYDGLSARDALHAAVMQRGGISRILSFDAGFDALPGLERIGA